MTGIGFRGAGLSSTSEAYASQRFSAKGRVRPAWTNPAFCREMLTFITGLAGSSDVSSYSRRVEASFFLWEKWLARGLS
ncbi:hypothetical protein E2C01_031823 [Portunus trituberculatus]|uniref:Uncharacterized protein n=1 Tax=Portunus trituberculatus TaxID=210409 RepID=A0A5B7EZ78_PORTR|nr:hypothetical protein [Portunus trituberculatus]